MEDIQVLLKKRQSLAGLENFNWEIKESKISGKGVFAARNLEPGDIIFKENPLVIGSRPSLLPTACVTCLKMDVPLKKCSKGCRLPVCGEECENSASHLSECELLNRLSPKDDEFWSPLLYRGLTPLRCLLLSEQEKDIIKQLSARKNNKSIEIMLLKEDLNNNFTAEEESFLELSCRVLNGTAFEVEAGIKGLGISLRGLFPLAGMMNHSCSPNTKHFYIMQDNLPIMYVSATCPIKEGEEITTSYCPLLWSTMARRHFLYTTKEFLCTCPRCRDPTEFGTYFSAHVCSCKGYLLPVFPLDMSSGWLCGGCGKLIPIHMVIAAEMSAINQKNSYIHRTNYLNIQKKTDFIWKIGHKKNKYSEVSLEDLERKKTALNDILEINYKLRLGESRIKDELIKELDDTLKEIEKRNSLVQ